MVISFTPKEKKKLVEDIITLQLSLWIPMHQDPKEEIEAMDDPSLFRYYKAHIILRDDLQ